MKKVSINYWSKNKSTSSKYLLKMIICLWNVFVLLNSIFSLLINGLKDSNNIKPCQPFILIRKPAYSKMLSWSMKIPKNSMKHKKHIRIKPKRSNKTIIKGWEDFGLRTKKLITEKSPDGKCCSHNKMLKNGSKKSLKPLNCENKWTHCLGLTTTLTICQLKMSITCKPIFKLEFWEKYQSVFKKSKSIHWCKKWIKHLWSYKIKFFSKNT